MRLIALFLTSNLFLFGCASQATLRIDSQPTGAYITAVDSDVTGNIPTPFVVKIDKKEFDKNKDSNGCSTFLSNGLKAVWASGATTTANGIKLCGSPTASYQYIFSRDLSYPDLDKDLEFASRQKASAAAQQYAQDQLSIAREALAIEQQKINLQKNEALKRSLTPPQPQQIYKQDTRCTTTYDPYFKEYKTICN